MKTKLIILILLLFLPLGNAWSQSPSNTALSDAEIEQIAQELNETTMSPYCPGRTLQACPSGQALELRNKIRMWLKQGYTKKGVKNQLLTIYGEDIRGTPRQEGFGLMAWITPALFVLIFGLLLTLGLRRMKSTTVILAREVSGEPSEQIIIGAEQEVEAELQRRLKF